MPKFSNMTDFAAHFGLSRSTVSYILNDKWRERNISPKTAKKVLDFAAEVGFTPNFLGLAINGKAGLDVAILLSDNLYAHHRQAFFNLLALLDKKNLKFLVFQLGSEEDNRAVLERMRNFRVSRALLFAPTTLNTPKSCAWWRQMTAANPDIRFLFYDYRIDRLSLADAWAENVCQIGFFEKDALGVMMDFVARQGYRTIINFFSINCSAAEAAARNFQLRVLTPPLADARLDGEIVAAALLSRPHPPEPEVVLVPDDGIAAVAIRRLLDAGFRVPEDYAFLSWDGLELSPYFIRSLTTLVIPHDEMIEFTGGFIAGEECSGCIRICPRLRLGESLPARETERFFDKTRENDL